MKATQSVTVLFGALSLGLIGACSNSEAQGERYASAKHPREVCTERTVTRDKPAKDKHRVLGTVAGALVGGVIGDKVGGHGTGGDIATVGGAAAGGYAGNRVQKSVQKNNAEQVTERECRTVYD